jgi:hypothetical protein
MDEQPAEHGKVQQCFYASLSLSLLFAGIDDVALGLIPFG